MDPQGAQDEQAAFYKQYQADQSQKTQQEQQPKQPPSFFDQFAVPLHKVSTTMLDTAVHAADLWGRTQQDLGAGEVTAVANTADAAHSLLTKNPFSFLAPSSKDDVVRQAISNDSPAAADRMRSLEQSEVPSSPIWDHARESILNLRDAIQVKDPTIADSLLQNVAQLAVPFAGYSRVLAGVHGIANAAVAGAVTDLTALQPHDMRMADLVSQARLTQTKYGEVLRQLAPDGSLLNRYIDFLTDRSGPEAENRFKNVLDGLTTNALVTSFLHTVGTTLKYGYAGSAYLMQNGVRNTLSDLAPRMMNPRELQEGKIGYHGTPTAGFDAFDNSKIGTGQGAQTEGYGHYVAEAEGTGKTYQKSLSGRMNNSAALSDAQNAISTAGGDKVKAFKTLIDTAANEKDTGLRMRMQNAARIIQSGVADRGQGSLMEVDIDDKHIANMLDLDKPMEKQPGVLSKIPMKDQKVLQKVLDDHGQDLTLSELTGREFHQLIERAHDENYFPAIDRKLYPHLKMDHTGADTSEFLSARGIPGNKYFDAKSRITGEGTRNYVVFDGKHIKVLGKK